MQMDEFEHVILSELESLVADHEIETLTRRPNPDEPLLDTAVKLVHRPSGVEIVVEEFPSQIKNKAIALVRLLKELRS